MGSWIHVAALLLNASSGPAVPEGCERQCVKAYAPCKDARQDEQMLCVEVVRHCEVRCPKQLQTVKTAARPAKK